jgi:hypothetical protein
MAGGEARRRPRMQHARLRQPASSQAVHSRPGETAALAALDKLRMPEPRQPEAKDPQAIEIARYRVIVEVALRNRPQPLPRVRHRLVAPPAEVLLKCLQLRPQASGHRSALHDEVSVPVLPANMREALVVAGSPDHATTATEGLRYSPGLPVWECTPTISFSSGTTTVPQTRTAYETFGRAGDAVRRPRHNECRCSAPSGPSGRLLCTSRISASSDGSRTVDRRTLQIVQCLKDLR